MSKKYDYQVTVFVEDDQATFRVRPVVAEDAIEDRTVILVDRAKAARDGVELDSTGFPTLFGLEAWHRKNNPQLFRDEVQS